MAGPWLAPNVVTAKSLPIVLPDMQLLRRQQKYAAAAAFEVQPRQRQLRKRASHGSLGVARLDDQDAARSQMARRVAHYRANRVQSPTPRGERNARLVPVFGGQRRELPRADIGRIADDDIVGLTGERTEMIGFDEAHALAH